MGTDFHPFGISVTPLGDPDGRVNICVAQGRAQDSNNPDSQPSPFHELFSQALVPEQSCATSELVPSKQRRTRSDEPRRHQERRSAGGVGHRTEAFARLVHLEQIGHDIAQGINALVLAQQRALRHDVAQNARSNRMSLGMIGIQQRFRRYPLDDLRQRARAALRYDAAWRVISVNPEIEVGARTLLLSRCNTQPVFSASRVACVLV